MGTRNSVKSFITELRTAIREHKINKNVIRKVITTLCLIVPFFSPVMVERLMTTETQISHPSLRGARMTSVGSSRMDDSSSSAGSSIYKPRKRLTVAQTDKRTDIYATASSNVFALKRITVALFNPGIFSNPAF